MEFITWPAGVNTNVLDGTSIEIGKGYIEDSENSGAFSERRLSSLAMPDSYNVQMTFDWSEKDNDGLSEFDRFIRWYKYTHCRGVNPFEFPTIAKFDTNGTDEMSYYRITGDLSVSKSALAYNVTMKWTEYNRKGISIPDDTSTVNTILADATDSERIVYVYFNGQRQTVPSTSEFTIRVNGTTTSVNRVEPSYTLTNLYKLCLGSQWASGETTITATYTEGGTVKTKSYTMEVN